MKNIEGTMGECASLVGRLKSRLQSFQKNLEGAHRGETERHRERMNENLEIKRGRVCGVGARGGEGAREENGGGEAQKKIRSRTHNLRRRRERDSENNRREVNNKGPSLTLS